MVRGRHPGRTERPIHPRGGTRGLGWCLLAGMLLSGAGRAQSVSEWRVYRQADGLAESLTTAITISPRGDVWVKHGEVEAVSWLNGYTVQHIPPPGGRNAHVYESRAGKIWSLNEDGLLEFTNDRWIGYPVAAMQHERETNPYFAIRPPPLLPVDQDRVLVLLHDQLLEFRSLTQVATVLRSVTNTDLGLFFDLVPALDGGAWVSGARGLAHLPNTSGPCAGFEMHLEDDIRNPLIDVGQHLAEHPVAFPLVFGLRVLLGPGTHPDTVLEMVHIIKMVFPGGVINLEQDVSFKLA